MFDGSHVSGHAACNSYFGDYQVDYAEGTVAFSGLGQTQTACDPALMQLDSAYLAALANFTSYRVVGDVMGEQFGLVLLGGNKAFTYAPEAPGT